MRIAKVVVLPVAIRHERGSNTIHDWTHPNRVNCRLIVSLWVALVLCACRAVLSSRLEPLTGLEIEELKRQSFSPDDLGIRITESEGQQFAKWREVVLPSDAVVLPLLAPDSPASHQPIVAARLNHGTVIPLLIDTGAPLPMIHARTVLANHVKTARPEELANTFKGLGGEEQAYYGMIDDLELGSIRYHDVLTVVRVQAYQQRFFGISTYHWNGNLLGCTSLSKLAFLQIDYDHRQATFSPTHEFQPARGANVFSFRWDNMSMVAKLEICGKTVEAVIDTGSDAGLMLNPKFIKEFGLHPEMGGKREKYLSLGGATERREFTVASMRIGSEVIHEVPAIEAPGDYPLAIGSGFLHDYRVTFDFRLRRVYLERNSN